MELQKFLKWALIESTAHGFFFFKISPTCGLPPDVTHFQRLKYHSDKHFDQVL